MKQLTDEEIIKALRCCRTTDCEKCPLFNIATCEFELYKNAIVLINRQKTEIERLKQLTDELSSYFPSCIGCNGKNHEGVRTDECAYLIGDTFYCAKRGLENIINTKSEAYKEFAEKLKNNMVLLSTENFKRKIITELGIEKVLKEMIGEEE